MASWNRALAVGLGLLPGLLLGSCATRPVPSDAFFERLAVVEKAAGSSPLTRQKTIDKVPFVLQEAGHCGPATLAMAMSWAGQPVSVDQLAAEVFTPGMHGSLQLDLVSAGRRHGLLAVPIHGFAALMSELVSGHPVIVFENLGLSWIPQWHYAVVYGYDLDRRELLLHSGPSNGARENMRRFEKDWLLAEEWGLVVLPPGELAASEGELANARAAAALESLGMGEAARKSYAAILGRWPESLAAGIGAANLAYARGEFAAAVGFLERATSAHPDSAAAWHNLTHAYGSNGQSERARASAERALALADESEKPVYQRSLAEWLRPR